MRKYIYYILLIFVSAISVSSQDKKLEIDYRLIIDFNAYPYFYENINKLNSDAFNGSVFFGTKIKQFTIGIELFESYVSFTSLNSNLNYMGAWNIFGSAISFYYQPVKWVELKTGVGGFWYKSAFSNNEKEIFSASLGGIRILQDGTFRSKFEYIDFSLINIIDLIFSFTYINPLYTGKLRINFHPFFNWINLYFEIGAMTIKYNGNPNDINSAAFVWGTGISFDLIMPAIFKYTKEKVANKKEYISKNELNNIEELEIIKQGESVIFTNIIFDPDSDKIRIQSYSELNKIAEVLIKRSGIVVEIIGHTNNTNKPELELILSIKRAETVRNYLIEKGIDQNRIKTKGYGSQFTKKASIEDANRKVEIKILEVK